MATYMMSTVTEPLLYQLPLKNFEMIMLENIMYIHDNDKFQFGFKAEHSTTVCIKIVKQTIDYFVEACAGLPNCSLPHPSHKC